MAYTDDNPYEDGPMQAKEEMPDHDKEETPHDTGIVTTVPANICPGMKPGDEMVLHIDKVVGDKYVVSYSPEKSKESNDGSEKEEEPVPAGMDASDSDMYS